MFLHKSLLLLLTFLCPFLSTIFSLPCADHRCRSGICAEDGTCICIPPSITLDGHRPFYGGRFCDELQIMCGVRSMFWCEHGGSCEEAVLGEEEYFCACPWGYAGRHCELVGAPCGEMFCFHGAECLVNEQNCQCPPDWRGSLDCVLPTSTNDSVVQSTPTILPPDKGHHIEKWFVAVVAVASSLLVVSAAVLLAKKCCRKSESALTKFQDLYQVQMQGVLDDEEDPSPVPELNDGAHL
ncbi:uncharacterized protein LOC116247218 [Nymphaea colorata]|nr:uncharacterized protein LOC116247218 [Nymphaea colorata]